MTFTGTLLPYQPEAVDRMCERARMLVAYDLGLGKTVLTIAAIERLMDESRIKEPGLIICLSSLKYQWANQIEKFTNGTSKALVIDGTPKKRAEQYEKALDWRNTKVDYIILNYEQVVNDWDKVRQLPRGFVVLDEATAIKSFKSKRSKAVKKLVNAPFRFALTGTPIENGKPEELYSIMQFVDADVLGRFDIFDSAFIVRNDWGGVNYYRNLSTLHTKMKEASVRKAQKDPDVAPYLPDSIHKEPVKITFDRKSSKLYTKITEDLLFDLDEAVSLFGSSFNVLSHYGYASQRGGPEDEMRGKIMSKIGSLKMLCSHPNLLRTSAIKFAASGGDGSAYAAGLVAFNNDPNIRVLISSDAGGYGVDLPAANLLVNYDLPWSSGSAIQRNGRIQRASSTWPSIVIQDLLVAGSIEERQHEALQQKTAIANAIIDGEGIDEDGGIAMTTGSLKQFLEATIV